MKRIIYLSFMLLLSIAGLAQFNTVPLSGSDTVTSCFGFLTDHAGASNYSSNANGTMVIDPPGSVSVSLEFSVFATESNADYVYIYDGVGTNGNVLGTYSGTSLPNGGNKITASSGAITVRFTSNSSINNTGFLCSWSADTTNLPIASFIASHSSVNFNSPVQFFNTTLYGGDYIWHFGDGNTSTAQNPTHSYTSAGIKTAYLIANNCKGTDTSASFNITVLPPPIGNVSVDTISFNMKCEGSDTATVTISNSGLGLLDYEFTLLDNLQNYDFHSTWEGTGLDGFINQNTGLYSTSIVTSSSAPQGNKYLNVSGDGLVIRDGLVAAVTDQYPEYISYYTKTNISSNSNGYVAIRGGTGNGKNMFFSAFQYGFLRIFIDWNGNGYTYSKPVSLGQWVRIELKNIDYTAKTFDLYVDEQLEFTGAKFWHWPTVDKVTAIQIYHINNGDIGLDDFKMGSDSVVDYVSFDPIQDTINALGSDQIEIIVDGSDLGIGQHYLDYSILSNDVNFDSSLFVLDISVFGFSELSLPDSCRNFGAIYNNQMYEDSLWISNLGCDTLFLDSIYTLSPNLNINAYDFAINPYDSILLKYELIPSVLGSFLDSLVVSGSDTTESICVSAQVIGAPIASVSLDTITIMVPCTGSDSAQFYISNSGSSDLRYELDIFQLMTSLSFHSTWEGSGLDGFVNQSPSLYSAATVTSSSAPQGNGYLEVTGDGLVVRDGLVAAVTDQYPEYISYYTKTDLSSNSNGYIAIRGGTGGGQNLFFSAFQYGNLRMFLDWNGNGYTHSKTVSLGQWVRIELKNIDYVAKTFDLYVDEQLEFTGAKFWHWPTVNKVTAIQVYHINNGDIGIDDFRMGDETVVDFIDYQPQRDSISGGDSTMVNVVVDGTKLYPGVHYYDFIVSSNDGNFDSSFIPIKIIVEGKKQLSVPDSCLDMGFAFKGIINTDSVLIRNTGCDTLNLDSIYSNSNLISGVALKNPLLRDDSTYVNISLLTQNLGPINDTLFIQYGDSLASICIEADVIGVPELQYSPTSLNYSVLSCKQNQVMDSVLIKNIGQDTLDYELSTVYLSGSNWITLGNPSIGNVYSQDSVFVPINLNGGSLSSGNYSALILIETNSPINMVDSLTIEFEVISEPDIDASSNCIHFGNVASNQLYMDSVKIYNKGCENLLISNITFNNTSFSTASSSNQTVTPGDSTWINVQFFPALSGAVNGFMTISNNDTAMAICLTANVVSPPLASFDDLAVNSCDGIIGFSDNSQNNPTSWEWDFGDGSISYAQNPTHTYSAPGFYTVKFKANNIAGTDSLSRLVDVTKALYPDFSTPDSIFVNQPFQVFDSSKYASSWQWFFGDGGSSTNQNPTHTYTSTGVFNISFITSNGFCNKTINRLVTVYQEIGIAEDLLQSVNLYPIPASDKLKVEWDSRLEFVKAEIFMLSGELIDEYELRDSRLILTVSDLNSGVYMMKLSDRFGNSTIRKFIVEL